LDSDGEVGVPLTSWEHIAVHTPISCPEFRWDLDEYRGPNGEQMLFAHIAVHKISPGLLKRMKNVYRIFREHVSAPLFAVGQEDDPKWEAFIAHFGFKYLTDVVCNNGAHRRMFMSVKNNNNNGKQFTKHQPSSQHEPSDHREQHDKSLVGADTLPASGV
jgi:hypothetical protein